MAEGMTQAAYARSRGVSKQAVAKLVRRGIVPLIDGKIDPDVADLKISQHLDPGRSKIVTTIGSNGSAHAVMQSPQAGAVTATASYQESRATRERYDALKRQLEVEQLAGTLVKREAVEKALAEAGRMLRDAIMAVPIRVAAQLAATSDAREVEAMLTKDLRRCLDDFARLAKDHLVRAAS
ncbi:MAG: hypothetical protein QJR02_07280 [Sinobacteraceae bacterium]|nr:hypothetical protein [Nevskiaceae bacterium]